MKNTIKKLMSLSLGVAIMFGALGLSATTTEASPRHHAPCFDAGDPPPPAPHHDKHHVEKPGDPPPAHK